MICDWQKYSAGAFVGLRPTLRSLVEFFLLLPSYYYRVHQTVFPSINFEYSAFEASRKSMHGDLESQDTVDKTFYRAHRASESEESTYGYDARGRDNTFTVYKTDS